MCVAVLEPNDLGSGLRPLPSMRQSKSPHRRFTYKGDREITPKAWYALNQMNETVEEGEEGDQAMDEDAPG